MKKIIVTIDGPAASGKEKISNYISNKWKLKHLDSGILYRRLAYFFLTNKIDFDNLAKIKKILKKIKKLELKK